MKKQMQLVRCTVNGREVEEYVDVRESLLDMLRNRLGLTSVKKGCEVGECGACTVIIDGETIDSCIYLAVWAEGKNIRTLEGLEKNGEQNIFKSIPWSLLYIGFEDFSFVFTESSVKDII